MAEHLPHITAAMFLIAVVLALLSAFWSGFTGDFDPAGGIILSFMWPLVAAVLLIIGPFWLAYKAGDRCCSLYAEWRRRPTPTDGS